MKEKVIDTVIKNKLINKGDNIVVGVSGGPDSIALLFILEELQEIIKFNLFVAHINHGIRGEEADKDEHYVKNVCEKLNIPFYSKKVNMDKYAKKHRLSSEEAGRVIRYKFFRELLSKNGGGKIAVAHNKNDQAETLILRIVRGTGIDGLKGMEYKKNDVIRPLLDIDRSEIEKFCQDNCLDARIDKTNLETIYGRNKVRLELIPYIEKNFNEGIIDTLVRTSKIMQLESNFLKKHAKKIYGQILIKKDKNSIKLNNKEFLKIHDGMKSRVLRNSIENLIGHIKGVEEKHIASIIELSFNENTGKEIHIGNNIRVKISYDYLIIENGNKKIKTIDTRKKVNIDGVTNIKELKMTLKTELIDRKKFNFNTKDRFIKYFDYDKIRGDLFIRNRKSGDKFTPLGMKGTKKIKDFFIDEKIPREERNKIPFIVDEEEITWVVGYRINEKYKITEKTERILKIEIVFS